MWHTSSYTGGGSNTCVEVRFVRDRRIQVRDSVHRELAELSFHQRTWIRLIAALRSGA
ncbi:DUF397 domain-containing protein [Nocardiopsis suaedae]|uniref:DUF397 domain-containing protein n=1 Tax=Nocardiopsis suaedae TaxID=3018444 RepID=A0ABT4TM92_9ACTN|nr:DUF397 domain-containing protein [Nocardiopsis suaedae]MDA2805824.1 DUF397 domain-containing protein [Nocardiopsis suaedae]